MAHNLLYISSSSKPEDMSTSKTVSRYMINQLIQRYPDASIEELDLYQIKLPMLNYRLFTERGKLHCGEALAGLSEEEKQDIDRINELCNQFLKADRYIISAPMWSMFFPAVLKQYLDCIFIQDKLIQVSGRNVKGLLDDKDRKMAYIESSGGSYPIVASSKLHQGAKYMEDVFCFLGISNFNKILVEGVDIDKIGKPLALEYAREDVDRLLKRYW